MSENAIKPTKQNPGYSCVVMTKKKGKFDFSNILIKLELTARKKQLAQCAKVKCRNVKCGTKYLNSNISVRDRVCIYADDGEKKDEVFRGFVWTVNYSSETEKELTFTCYDNLIYFQESDDNRYFPSGYDSKTICQNICGSWGITLDYSYSSIVHGKMKLEGSLSDIILTQILEKVRQQTGERYVIRSEMDIVKILPVGKNSTVYELKTKENVLGTKSEITMDGMVTKIVILGEADEDGQSKVEAVVDGDTEHYGTLQKIQKKDGTTELADAQKEAEQTIKNKGKPTRTFEVEAMDIPWLKLGDKVKVAAGDMLGDFFAVGVSHLVTDTEKTMRVTLEAM